jgi:hypothetical protein
MTMSREYSRQQARSIYFDANGNRVLELGQHAALPYDPWRALKELENNPEPECSREGFVSLRENQAL